MKQTQKRIRKEGRKQQNTDREHNKSGSSRLSILEYDDKKIIIYIQKVKNDRKKAEGSVIKNCGCTLIPPKDGRLTVDRKKVGHAYTFMAFDKYGREALNDVPTVKSNNSLVISHLCGTENCTTGGDHIILEPKWVNDQRAYCHFCIRNAFLKGGWKSVILFHESGACSHNPNCCDFFLNKMK